MITLREIKPTGLFAPVHVTVEYLGKRFLISHCSDFWSAERIALDFQKAFPLGAYFTGDVYNSTCIDGKAKDFRKLYKGKTAS
jgi:hypothetical protein